MRVASDKLKDYHKVLGVRKGAGMEEIRRAFRRLALLFHPDRNRDAGAEARFKEISEAYAILSGKEKAPEMVPATGYGRERRRGGSRAMTDWASIVMAIWQDIEEEKFNNMYR